MQRLKTLPRTHRKEASGIPACLSPKANWVVHVALPCESLGHPGCRCARSLAGKKSGLGATLETRASRHSGLEEPDESERQAAAAQAASPAAQLLRSAQLQFLRSTHGGARAGQELPAVNTVIVPGVRTLFRPTSRTSVTEAGGA